MAKCSFCQREIEPGKGIIFVTVTGKIYRFCSRKCRVAFKLRRSKKLGWIRKTKKGKK